MSRELKLEMRAQAERVVLTMSDARVLVEQMGLSPAKVSFTNQANTTIHSIVDWIDRMGWLGAERVAGTMERWSDALAYLAGAKTDPAVAARLGAFVAVWRRKVPAGVSLPLDEEIAEIIGTDPATVKRLLDADAPETKLPRA